MSFAGLLVHEVQIVTAAESEDDYGNTVYDWGLSATRVTSMAWITQLGTSEDRNDRQTPAASWICFLPSGTAVNFTNRIEWGDVVFEVDGLPLVAWTPAGEHHIQAPLRYSAGAVAAAVADDYGAY